MPQLSNEQASELIDMAGGLKPFDPTKAKHLLESTITLRLLQKAADSTAACDWGLPVEDGPSMIMPHLAKMRQMSSLAIVRAEALFAEGKSKEGLDWLLVAHRMARHAGTGDVLISYLVQNVMEANALRAAARHCLGWDAEMRHGYAVALKSLPPLHTAQAAFHGEHIFIDWAERHLTSDGKPDSELQAALTSAASEQSGSKEAAASLLASDTTKAALTTWRDVLARMGAALGKPWLQARPELKALEDEARHSSHALVRITVPTTMSVAERAFTVATLQTMLDAALQHGAQLDETSVSTYHDSLEGEPLRLKKADDGTLTLVAALPHPTGKEISLRLGK